ncbi:MAG: hypothetical protein KME20_20000 [Kaiparowitsia implicata GSE-PSE-MK54-09C]|nr:hypothetical protein [Kaiparowitsia implicata GSE-PSE-MK54-09C]
MIEQSAQRLNLAFQQAIQAGQAKGEILTHQDAADLAKHAIAVGDGALLHNPASGVQASGGGFSVVFKLN